MTIKRMPDEKYFKINAVSNSLLSRFEQCPAAVLIEKQQTPQMALGSAAHCLILEGRKSFEKRFAVAPECDRRTKEGKEVYRAFCAEHSGKTIITMEQLETCTGMAKSVANHPSARQLLSEGMPEMSITWKHGKIKCKAKADWICQQGVVDLKTTQSSAYEVFSRTVVNSGYYRQMAFYRDGIRSNGWPVESAFIIAVDNTEPFSCEVFELNEELLQFGQVSYQRLLAEYIACRKKRSFPAFRHAGILTLRPPAWMTGDLAYE